MQYSFSAVALLALVGLSQAQIPACATKCIADAVTSATTCGATDLVCQCEATNQAALTTAATPCVLSSCGSEALSVLSAAQAACEAVLAAPASSTLASISSAVSSIASSASSVVASVSSAASSSVAASTSAAASSASSAASAASSSHSASHSASAVPLPSPSSTSSAAPTQVTGNGAGQIVAGAGSLFAAGVAVLAVI